MVSCKRCGKNFKYDHQLIYHLCRAYKCTPILSNIDTQILLDEIKNNKSTKIVNNQKVYCCQNCKKIFNSCSSKSRHLKTCKLKETNKNNTTINDNSINNNNSTNNSGNDNSSNNNSTNNTNTNSNNNSNNINNSTNIHDNSTQNITNNTTIKLDSLGLLNSFISNNNLGASFKSFPTYTIGHLYKDMFNLINKIIKKCKIDDISKEKAYQSKFNLVLEIFKEIMAVDDIQTKNMYINNINDSIAFCLLDGQFYTIHVNDLFEIICEHLPIIVDYLKKTKDQYNGMNKDDKDYTEFANENFKEFINNKNSDKTYLKQEIIKCIYNNKKALEKLINISEPIGEFNKNYFKTLSLHQNKVNNLRKRCGLKSKTTENHDEINVNTKDKKYRNKTSIKLNDNDENTNIDNDDKIIIDYNNTQNKRFPDGKICYTTIYKGVDIWYHEECELGCFVGDKKLNLIPVEELKFIINNIINKTKNYQNSEQVNIEEPVELTDIEDDSNYSDSD